MVSMFVNTCYGSFNLGICHIIWALVSHGYICPNIGILASPPTFRVLMLLYRLFIALHVS